MKLLSQYRGQNTLDPELHLNLLFMLEIVIREF